MSTQHKALELADSLENIEYNFAPTGPYGQTESFYRTPNGSSDLDDAAALLRSQHTLIGELLEALRDVLRAHKERLPSTVMEAEAELDRIRSASAKAHAAIAKATGEEK